VSQIASSKKLTTLTALAGGITVAYRLLSHFDEPFLSPQQTAVRFLVLSIWGFLLFLSLVRLLRISLLQLPGMERDDSRIEDVHMLFLPILLWWTLPFFTQNPLIDRMFNGYLPTIILVSPIVLFGFLLLLLFGRDLFHKAVLSPHRFTSVKWVRLILVPVGIVVLGYVCDRLFITALSALNRAKNRNIVLISIDTLRPDYLGCYGASYGLSPAVDLLATEGVLYENTYSASSITAPSHMTMFTGLLPSEHGVNPQAWNEKALSPNPDVPILAEILHETGYHTVAFTDGAFVHPRFGFDRGFDIFEPIKEVDSIDSATSFIEAEDPRRKLFLFIHTYEVHGPGNGGPEDRYRESIASVDKKLDRLFHALREGGYEDNTLIVFTSDHGEGFGEHGLIGHGNSLYEELLRVPLIMKGPSLPANTRVSSLVSLLDLAPTVLKWARVTLPNGMRDASLLESLNRPATAGPDFSIFSELIDNAQSGSLHSIVTSRYKYIKYQDRNEEFLFDLSTDPAETQNLVGREPAIVENHRTMAERIFANMNVYAPVSDDIPQELADQLKALGYVQ